MKACKLEQSKKIINNTVIETNDGSTITAAH